MTYFLQTITFTFLESNPDVSPVIVGGSEIQKRKVREVIKEWENWANIKFEEKKLEKPRDKPGYLRISFNTNDGSWSYVGKSLKDKTEAVTMNFGWVKDEQVSVQPKERGVILHEFGHALGMLHEHASPARGGRLTLKVDGTWPIVYIGNRRSQCSRLRSCS